MGLAASQARLLLLTARKSDLEFRAQLITNRKMLLAMQTEEVASAYSKALNDRTLFYTFYANQNKGDAQTEQLTYANLTAQANFNRFRVVEAATGKVVALDQADSAKYNSTLAGTYTMTQNTDGTWSAATASNTQNVNFTYDWANILNNPEAFQNAIQSGVLIVEQMTDSTPEDSTDANNVTTRTINRTWAPVAVSGVADISSRSNTTNDAAATAKYEYDSLVLQNADKQLDVELKQIETQQKACENEIDSVKKVLDKNIEKSFKTFA